MKRSSILILLLGVGCAHVATFPSGIPDRNYPNGHALALNGVTQDNASLEAQLVALTNAQRASAGLRPLGRLGPLDAVARGHSIHMGQHHFMAHVNPEGDAPVNRLSAVASGFDWVAENCWLVEPTRDAAFIFAGFMASPEHKDNILLADATSIGVGIALYPNPGGTPSELRYVTMEFIKESR